MATTLYTANPTALIPQAGRAVDTFPSGLARVSQTFLGRTANAAAHRATLAVGNNMPGGDSSPCMDGLKIFPEVQERRREDGMTEFIVTAYGRTNSTGKLSRTTEIQTVQVPTFLFVTNLPSGSFNSNRAVPMAVVVATTAVSRSTVVPAATSSASLSIPEADTSFSILSTTYDALVASLKKFYPTASFALSGLNSAITVSGNLSAMSRNSYGSFDEVIVTVSGVARATNFAQINITL